MLLSNNNITFAGVESLQTQWAWYASEQPRDPTSEHLPVAQHAPRGWERASSISSSFHNLHSRILGVKLEITQAPAEWALPVKTDRQFSPIFQARVRFAIQVSKIQT
jgi:hypothetical protein